MVKMHLSNDATDGALSPKVHGCFVGTDHVCIGCPQRTGNKVTQKPFDHFFDLILN